MNKFNGTMRAAVCLLLTGCTILNAQESDTSHLLKEAEIKSFRPNYAKANYLNEIYTANALQFQLSDLYIKNYGIGQLSTFSVRGLGPENVAIIWQGIPINSPLNGLMDLNQVPNSLLQSIQYSTDDNRLCSGGFLALNQTQVPENIVAISSTSYLSNLFSHKIDGSFKFKKTTLSFNNQFTHGKNNYEHINTSNGRGRLDHNSVNQYNTQIFYKYELGKMDLNLGFWYQYQDREIPSSDFYPVTTQSLIDRNYRSYIGVSNTKWDLKLSYSNEAQKYDDQDLFFPTHSLNKIQTIKGVVNYSDKLSEKFKVNYILYPAYYIVESTNLADTTKNILEAIQQINLKYYLSSNIVLEGGLKTQFNTQFSNLMLPYIGLNYILFENFSIGLSADMNARNPTANDLYYSYYGNLNLVPETNYQLRNTWRYKNANTYDKVQFTIEPYYIRSIDKINYVPDSAFRVFNIDKVTSFGFTSNIEWIRKINLENNLRTIVGFNYIESKDQSEFNLAYVPNFKTILSFNWINTFYEILMQNNYTSQRYANQANTASLNPYLLTNLKATYKHTIKKSQLNFSLGIDNLWNENYQEINGSFMPLRNYYLNFTTILR